MVEPEGEKFQKILFDRRNHELALETTIPLQQKEGLVRLYSFLWEGADFSQLSPFLLNISSRTVTLEKRDNSQYNYFYLGAIKGINKYLSFTIPIEDDSRNGGVIWAFPRTLSRGLKPYYWLEFYNPSSLDANALPFSGCSLDPTDDTKKIGFMGWHGIEEELLADYILGENKVSFDDLLPFTLDIKKKKSFLYRIAGRKGLNLNLNENVSIEDGDRIRLIPLQDPRQVYQWIDIVKMIEESPPEDFPLVSSYMISQDRRTLTTKGWFGCERQLIIDYLTKQRGIRFNDLRPFRTSMSINLDYLSIVQTRHTIGLNLAIYPPIGAIVPGEEIVILPKQDDQELYQWLEGYKTDPETHDPIGKCIVAVRMVDGKFHQRDWAGPELQLLKDFVKEQVSFDNLRQIPLVVSKGRELIHLWREKDHRVYIVLSQLFGLQPNDELTLDPVEETDGSILFLLKKDFVPLGRYNFSINNQRFTLEELLYQAGGGWFDNTNGTYTDTEGERWISINQLRSRYGLAYPTLRSHMDGIRRISYKHKSSIRFYNEAEVVKALEACGYSVREKLPSPDLSAIALQEYEEILLSGQLMSYEEFMNMKGRQK